MMTRTSFIGESPPESTGLWCISIGYVYPGLLLIDDSNTICARFIEKIDTKLICWRIDESPANPYFFIWKVPCSENDRIMLDRAVDIPLFDFTEWLGNHHLVAVGRRP